WTFLSSTVAAGAFGSRETKPVLDVLVPWLISSYPVFASGVLLCSNNQLRGVGARTNDNRVVRAERTTNKPSSIRGQLRSYRSQGVRARHAQPGRLRRDFHSLVCYPDLAWS